MIEANQGLPRVIRQGLVGALCFGLNLVLMWSLVSLLKLSILAAASICFFVLHALGHHLSRIFAFPDADNRYAQSLLRFLAVMATSLGLNLIAMKVATEWLGLHYLLASALIAILFFFGNYLAHYHWTFRSKSNRHMATAKIVPPPDIRNIVCVTHFFPTRKGGIEAVAFEINRRLAENGILVDWFASAGANLPAPVAGINFRPVKAIDLIERLAGVPLPLWLSKDILPLYTAIRDCDAVHVHDFIYPGSLLALAFSLRWKKPLILTQHIGHIPYRSHTLTALLSAINHSIGRWALRRASRVVFISNAVEAYFRSFVTFRNPPVYLPNGVDSDIFKPVDNAERLHIRQRLGLGKDDRVCLFVGRFVEKKGLQLLAELVKQTPDLEWIFAGEGPLHPGNWQAPNVHLFEGWRRERLADLYRAADLLILPSRGEGFPLVVQEAFACGTPVLISDEAAAGCENARPLLFELPITGNGLIECWKGRLDRLFVNPALLHGRRESVASFASNEWSWTQNVSAYTQLYCDSTMPVGSYSMPKSTR